jgi:hypothetical protein
VRVKRSAHPHPSILYHSLMEIKERPFSSQ